MSTHPLGYYVAGPAITDLADQYGDRLINMPLREKLHALMTLAAALDFHEVFPGEPISVETEIPTLQDFVDPTLSTHLKALNGNRAQMVGLIQAIASYLE